MEYLNEFPLEFVKPFAFCFKLLNTININLIGNETSSYKRNWKFCFELPFVLLHNISMLAYLINLFSNGAPLMEISESLPIYVVFLQVSFVVSLLTAISKVLILLSKRTKVKELVNDLGTRWRTTNLTQKQEQNRKRSMKRLQWCLKSFYYLTMFGSTQHIIGPICYMIIGRIFLNKPLKLVLPFGCVYPYDPFDNWFIYLGTYGYQAVIMYGMVYGFMGCECIMIAFCANLVSEFAILREDLLLIMPVGKINTSDELTSDIKSSNGRYTRISIQTFIREHQDLIRMSELLDDIFNRIVMVDMMLVTIIMCFFGFATSIARGMIETANNAVGVFVTLFPVFLFCLFGESLKEESLGIADSAYESLWYKGDQRYQKMILLVILRSQRPCCLTMLKHAPVSLNMFTKVLSSTWSYFSLIRSVYTDT